MTYTVKTRPKEAIIRSREYEDITEIWRKDLDEKRKECA